MAAVKELTGGRGPDSVLEGAVAAVTELTGGRGADSVLEIVGSKPAMALAGFAAMRPDAVERRRARLRDGGVEPCRRVRLQHHVPCRPLPCSGRDGGGEGRV